ncbi:MAG: S26 family signal peptidase [Candidatus Thalassarchaeaceae archaeon]|nr:S26 family signal peptidase [Candidatus Thalassarchaeaceae archaeon]
MSTQDPILPDNHSEPNQEGPGWWIREALLAFGLVALILGSMWISTGMFPPMVVVESTSMMHDNDGSLGAIDPGDLVLVMHSDRADIVTFAEATEPEGENFGYDSHGMPGDVIIYRKNGGDQTPVIHRAILKAVTNGSGGWDVPGTTLLGVASITWTLDYECPYHGGSYNLEIDHWTPSHEGYLTAGDNNDCMLDQPSANRQGMGSGLTEHGNPVLAVKDEWIVGIASSEIPWIGSIKLLASGTQSSVTQSTWNYLALTILTILASPLLLDPAVSALRSSTEEE